MLFIELLRASPDYTRFTVYKWTGSKWEQFEPAKKTKKAGMYDQTADYIRKNFPNLCAMYVRKFISTEKNYMTVYLQNTEP